MYVSTLKKHIYMYTQYTYVLTVLALPHRFFGRLAIIRQAYSVIQSLYSECRSSLLRRFVFFFCHLLFLILPFLFSRLSVDRFRPTSFSFSCILVAPPIPSPGSFVFCSLYQRKKLFIAPCRSREPLRRRAGALLDGHSAMRPEERRLKA